SFYGVLSKVTSDCLVDCLTQWWESVGQWFAHISTLVINLDKGPENHSRRTQFRQRMVDFVHDTGLHVRL
ncbi:transposase, partial [Candidatus Entotheonella serta]